MKVLKKSFIAICLLLSLLFGLTFATVPAKADTGNYSGEEVQPRGIYTSLSLTIDGGNGEVWATAKNAFTMFPSSVYVIVQLYSSETYQDSYLNMKLEAQNVTKDLDMGKTITAAASTNGTKRYWKARAYYKVDKKDWKEKLSDTWLFDGDGIVVL